MGKKELLSHLPCGALLFLERVEKNQDRKWLIQGIRLKAYAAKMDISSLQLDIMESRRIELVEWDYPLFQVSFLENIVALCLNCLSNGYSPFICFTNTEGTNLWDQFCKQPCSNSASERWTERKVNFKILAFPSKDEITLNNSVFRQLVHFMKMY